MPLMEQVSITNKVYTVPAGGKSWVNVDELGEEGNTYVAKGQIALKNGPISVRRTIRDPGLYTVAAFDSYLNSWGVKTSGKINRGATPAGAYKILTHTS